MRDAHEWGRRDGSFRGRLTRSDPQATHIYFAVLVLYALNLTVGHFTLKMEVRPMCEECERLDEKFIAVRARSVSGIDQIDSLLRKELFDEWAWTLGFRSWERVFAPTI